MEKFSFSKAQRLLSCEDFDYLKSRNLVLKASTCLVYVKKSRLNSEHTRLGLSVSKKTGNAVKRNRIKRILRETFRMSSFKNLGQDILLVVSSRGKFEETKLCNDFIFLLDKIGKLSMKGKV